MIPFSPPRIDERTIEEVVATLRSGWITTGPRTKELERRLAGYCGAKKVIALSAWTTAAELVLRWFGIGPGDEVIVPAYTYCATANIVLHVGATPVMVDILDDFTIDPRAVARAITPRTKCVIPVLVVEEARARFAPTGDAQERLGRALVLSDAAHAFGARIDGRPVGTQADITGFSFHAVKNLTTAEGGALVFNLPGAFDPDELYRTFGLLSLHGQSKDALSKMQAGSWKYDVTVAGWKCNMTDLQAALGLVELERYDADTLVRRRAIFQRYSAAFEGDPRFEAPPYVDAHRLSSFHLYMLRVARATEEQRDAIIAAVSKRDVSVNVHFIPMPLLSLYRELGYRIEDYPNAYRHYSREISLPVYYDLTDDQVDTVIAAVKDAVVDVMGP
jgi:dTDP-4-amino-4,6-dideoxygalactose transaminase